jgi:hypothetical protein
MSFTTFFRTNCPKLSLFFLLGTASVAQAQAPFACAAGKSYLFLGNPTNAYEFDIASGTITTKTSGGLVAAPNQQLNAFGYNVLDNLLYSQRNGTNQLVQTDANFASTVLSVSGLTGNDITNAVVGDVDKHGIMYLTRGGSVGGGLSANGSTGNTSFVIHAIDLTQPTLQARILPVQSALTFINDWAVSPADGNLYTIYSTISANTPPKLTLYRYITTGNAAGTRNDLGEVTAGPAIGSTDHPIVPSNFGSAFMDDSGDLYVVANVSGYIYRIRTPDKGNLVANYVTTSSITNQNNSDGARCPSTAISTSPLPVTLTSFTATAAPNRSVHLGWTTASELNNKLFEVQRSHDGHSFETIGRVAGHGNLLQPTSYSFTDSAPGAVATHYYRLRQVDLDGTATFSAVQTVTLAPGASALLLTAAPNPTSPANIRVQVQYGGAASVPAVLTLHSLLGQSLFTQSVTLQPGANILTASTSVGPGIYWLTVGGDATLGQQGVKVLLTN